MNLSLFVCVIAFAIVPSALGEDFVDLLSLDNVETHLRPNAEHPHSCLRIPTYRGVGHLGECAKDEERQMGLCYKICDNGGEGQGPICWEACPKRMETALGAFCCANLIACSKDAREATKLAADIARVAADASVNPIKLPKDIRDLISDAKSSGIPECSKL